MSHERADGKFHEMCDGEYILQGEPRIETVETFPMGPIKLLVGNFKCNKCQGVLTGLVTDKWREGINDQALPQGGAKETHE